MPDLEQRWEKGGKDGSEDITEFFISIGRDVAFDPVVYYGCGSCHLP